MPTAGLGDLTPFRIIAEDTLRLIEQHDFLAAKVRITSLETAWDAAEERLQPLDPDEWASVDETIDRALALPHPPVCIGGGGERRCVSLKTALARLMSCCLI